MSNNLIMNNNNNCMFVWYKCVNILLLFVIKYYLHDLSIIS